MPFTVPSDLALYRDHANGMAPKRSERGMTQAMTPAEKLAAAADHVRDGRWIAGLPAEAAEPVVAWLTMSAEEYRRREGMPKYGDPNPNFATVDLTGSFGPCYWSLALDLAEGIIMSVAASDPFHRPRPEPFRSMRDQRADALVRWFEQQVRDDLSACPDDSPLVADLNAKLAIVDSYVRANAEAQQISDKVVARIRYGEGNPGMPASMVDHGERIEFTRAAEALRFERHTLFFVVARLAVAYAGRDGYLDEWNVQ